MTTTAPKYPGNRSASDIARYATANILCPTCGAKPGADCADGGPGWVCRARFASACVALKKPDLPGPQKPGPRHQATCPGCAAARAGERRATAEASSLRARLASAQAQLTELQRRRDGDEFLASLDGKVQALVRLTIGSGSDDEAAVALSRAWKAAQALSCRLTPAGQMNFTGT